MKGNETMLASLFVSLNMLTRSLSLPPPARPV